jgi:dual specificity MAP kinase phosphatase
MANMSKASEIVANVFLGPTPDWETCSSDGEIDPKHGYDIYIEASDLAQMPDKRTLAAITEAAEFSPQRLEVPSSGSIMPPTWSQAQIDGLLDLCRWMYELTNHTPVQQVVEADGDIPMTLLSSRPRKILLHCADGYTETTLLAVAYFMYSECIPVHEAWLRLHCEKKRNFFAYQSDVALLRQIQPRIMQESPLGRPLDLSSVSEPKWLNHMDGSLPSRILPYMYLGNLLHANNPELLRALGIKRILSIGEPVSWPLDELTKWPEENLLMVDRVQDNGIDPLTSEFDRCLEFIGTLFIFVINVYL